MPTITKANILHYFRRQRSKSQAYAFFECVREGQKHTIEVKRYCDRFEFIFNNLIGKEKITPVGVNRFQATNASNSQSDTDDAPAQV